jgi:hypothetical protein
MIYSNALTYYFASAKLEVILFGTAFEVVQVGYGKLVAFLAADGLGSSR